jgi:deoxyribodipyrimidine photo-lyase
VRVRLRIDRPAREDGSFVLYWMTTSRRAGWNFALERAARWAERLKRPLIVLEALRCDYPWASERLHRFVLEGMQDNAADFAGKPVAYYPYVEPRPGAGKGLVAALARDACLVVGDDYPVFMLPRMEEAAAKQIGCRFELVDSNGLLPMRAAPRVFGRAVDFRRYLQKELAPWLDRLPQPDPLARAALPPAAVPAAVLERWPAARGDLPRLAESIHFAHRVPAAAMAGGRKAALARLESLVSRRLARYSEDRDEPELEGTSGLSPYLHFGQIGAHEIFARIAAQQGWSPGRLGKANGGRVPRPARHVARAGLQLLLDAPGLRRLRVAARLGARHAGGARRRSASSCVYGGTARGRANA